MNNTKERAKQILEEYANCYSEVDVKELAECLNTIKAEAYKEFAERLDNKAMFPQEINDDYAVGLTIIKKTLKELVGDTK